MLFQDVAKRLGVEGYPEALDAYLPIPEHRKHSLCSMELIERLQERFDLFGHYYDLVCKCWEELTAENGDRKHFVDAVSLCIMDMECKPARRMKYPEKDGSPVGDMLPLYCLLPSVEGAYGEMIGRGFSHGEAMDVLNGIKESIGVVEHHTLGRPGLTDLHANWCVLYIKCRIFYHKGLNYELHTSPSYNPYVLRNKKTGELIPVFGNGFAIHKSGIPLGSGGCEDEADSFVTTFEETDDDYVGHLSQNFLVERERKHFPKAEWEIVYRFGDHGLSVHIPRNTDFSPETVSQSMKEALERVRKCYPEWEPKVFFCSSWLLSPVLQEVLGESAKISSFALRYMRYPRKSAGNSPFSYVYPLGIEKIEDLPEDTRLQRGLKKVYLEGGFVYDTSGIILID